MGVTQKCLNLLRLKQHFHPRLEFGKPIVQDRGYPEQEVIRYLKSWNKNLKQDSYGNLYLINPGTPLLSAHMDTVQGSEDADRMPYIKINKKKGTISYNNSIIGGDDKCGIAMAMTLYEKYGDKVSLLFTRQEETGMQGASAFCREHSDLLIQCKYCLVMDRRNAGDIIGYNNRYCSKEFEDEIHRCTKDFGYEPATGLASDANVYSKYINCVNLSVGYYEAHRKTEYIVIDELKNAVKAVENIIDNFQGEYEIYKEPERKSYYSGRSQGSLYSYSRDDYSDYRDNYNAKYKKKKEEEEKEKKKSKISEAANRTRKYFKILHNGDFEVSEDLILVNNDNREDSYEVPMGTFSVYTRDQYTELENAMYEAMDTDQGFISEEYEDEETGSE